MNFYIKQSLTLASISMLLYLLLYVAEIILSLNSYYSILGISIFFFSSTFIVVSLIKIVHQFAADKVGFAFMGLILLKAFASILFLLPGFLAKEKPDFIAIVFFFIPYFLFLVYEAIQAIKVLNKL